MSTPTPAGGFILAGGKSSRMGRDKSLLDWHGRTLLEHMIALLLTISEDVHTVGRGELPDSPAGLGPIGGLATALHSSQKENNIVVAVDLPLLTKEFLKYFKERFDRARFPLTVCRIDSRFPLCIGARRSLRETVDNYVSAGRRSIHGLIQQIPSEIITADDLGAEQTSRLFMNINTDADYKTALAVYKP